VLLLLLDVLPATVLDEDDEDDSELRSDDSDVLDSLVLLWLLDVFALDSDVLDAELAELPPLLDDSDSLDDSHGGNRSMVSSSAADGYTSLRAAIVV
jgi:hypothetical protein